VQNAGLQTDVTLNNNFHRKPILKKIVYSLQPIILFANIDVSRHILVVDTSLLAKGNMDWREYHIYHSLHKNILSFCKKTRSYTKMTMSFDLRLHGKCTHLQ
jgi:hypothetical protein